MSGSRFVFIFEGHTESKSLPNFLSRSLGARGITGVGIDPINLKTASRVFSKAPEYARNLLNASDGGSILRVYSLLDLYNAGIFETPGMPAEERIAWGTQQMQSKYRDSRYRHFFAVHEVEAWLLADNTCLPKEMRADLKAHQHRPEEVNDNNSPAKLIAESHLKHFGRKYSKPEHGAPLFSKLDPQRVYDRCPYFRDLLDDMIAAVDVGHD